MSINEDCICQSTDDFLLLSTSDHGDESVSRLTQSHNASLDLNINCRGHWYLFDCQNKYVGVILKSHLLHIFFFQEDSRVKCEKHGLSRKTFSTK